MSAPSRRRAIAGAALVATTAIACATERAPAPRLVLRGPLAAFVERAPASLATCTPVAAPVAASDSAPRARECLAALDDRVQYLVVRDDSTVAEVAHEWLLAEAARAAAWEREAARLTSAFGAPVRERRPPADTAEVRAAHARWRGYCAAWRGDSLEVVLRLDPLVDMGEVRDSVDWRLSRWLRRGALPDAIACGLHRDVPGETASGAAP